MLVVLVSCEYPRLLRVPLSLVNGVISFQRLPSLLVFLYSWMLLQGLPPDLFRYAETRPPNPLIADNAIADTPTITLVRQF
jgi:hypothetical protein